MRAFDARTGDIVWTFRTGSNFRNSPITYIGPDGRQYVAIIGSQRPGRVQVTPDAAPDAGDRFRRAGSALYMFALPPARNCGEVAGARQDARDADAVTEAPRGEAREVPTW